MERSKHDRCTSTSSSSTPPKRRNLAENDLLRRPLATSRTSFINREELTGFPGDAGNDSILPAELMESPLSSPSSERYELQPDSESDLENCLLHCVESDEDVNDEDESNEEASAICLTHRSDASTDLLSTSETVEKHGLVRYIHSEDYNKAKLNIEKHFFVKVTENVILKENVLLHSCEEGRDFSLRLSSSPFSPTSSCVGNVSVLVKQGSIAEEKVDVILNLTSSDLDLSFALASKAVLEAAGENLQKECSDYVSCNGSLSDGDIVATSGHNLSCASIFHAYCANSSNLTKFVSSCLKKASSNGASSIALPALGTGRMGVSSEASAKAIFDGIKEYIYSQKQLASLKRVYIVVYDQSRLSAFESALSAAKRSIPLLAENTMQQANDCVVSVEQGDITKDASDVIVVPTDDKLALSRGIVAKAVLTAAGSALSNEISQNHSSRVVWGDLADLGSGNLKCKRVYALACRPWNNDDSKAKNLSSMKESVLKCLELANRNCLTSIAMPALGTGSLNYSDDSSAAAIFDAIVEFCSVHSSLPSLRRIKVLIYDSHRLTAYANQMNLLVAAAGDNGGLPLCLAATALFDDKIEIIKLSNNSVVAVSQGDIVQSTSDVIVVPTDNDLAFQRSNVGAKVSAAAGDALSSSVKKDYASGVTWGEMADLSAGKLNCRRIYGLACKKWNSKDSKANNLASLKDSVLKCLLAANEARHTSISVPALGTQSLGYSDKHSAKAIFEAAKEFSLRLPMPLLQVIEVLILDSHRIKEFKEQMIALSACTKCQDLHSDPCIANRVVEVISEQLRTIEPKFSDKVKVTVSGECSGQCRSALKEILDSINRSCVEKQVCEDYPPNLNSAAFQQIKKTANKHHVVLSVSRASPSSEPQLFLAGWKEDWPNASEDVNKEMLSLWKKQQETKNKYSNVVWFRYFINYGFCSYSEEVSIVLEEAYQSKKTAVIADSHVEYSADLKNRRLTLSLESVTAKLKREAVTDGVTLPPTWTEPFRENVCNKINLFKCSWEYARVEQKFRATLGERKQQILSIQRIQNRQYYIGYVNEKKKVQQKLARHGKSSLNSFERELWHGTKAEAVEHIVEDGFNRSLAGDNVGMKYGKGVYFAVNSSYSCSDLYAKPSPCGTKTILLCKVLVGQCTKGKRGLTALPIINSDKSKFDHFDSAVDNTTNPTIFVCCFRDHQAYPDYLITFK